MNRHLATLYTIAAYLYLGILILFTLGYSLVYSCELGPPPGITGPDATNPSFYVLSCTPRLGENVEHIINAVLYGFMGTPYVLTVLGTIALISGILLIKGRKKFFQSPHLYALVVALVSFILMFLASFNT